MVCFKDYQVGDKIQFSELGKRSSMGIGDRTRKKLYALPYLTVSCVKTTGVMCKESGGLGFAFPWIKLYEPQTGQKVIWLLNEI